MPINPSPPSGLRGEVEGRGERTPGGEAFNLPGLVKDNVIQYRAVLYCHVVWSCPVFIIALRLSQQYIMSVGCSYDHYNSTVLALLLCLFDDFHVETQYGHGRDCCSTTCNNSAHT